MTEATTEETLTGEPGAEPEPHRRPRRTRRLLAALGVLAAVGGAAAAGAGLQDGGSGEDRDDRRPPATAEVTRQTLRDSRTEDGELGYGTSTTATGRVPGTVTQLPEAGERITRGEALYRVDDEPVLLMYGAVPAYRELRPGAEGRDVAQLERNLKALGHDGFTVDDTYTEATADAVRQWQQDLGLEETGTVEPGRVVFAPAAVRVDTLDTEEGATTAPGQKVLSYTATAQAVTVELDTADRRLAEPGAKVDVELPDGTRVDGRVSEVTTEVDPGNGAEENPSTKVKVLVALDGAKAQQAAASYVLASVDVSFTAGEREDVLTVPVAALVALEGGGFGVEVVEEDGGTSYVPVETGLFADGRVEISGDGITAGTTVGMPA
ncbi:efflux RND transporter periplasmic adaptor subunit [Streptomyces cupreus]|uniref:Peptidoglycan-binding protein n=1 Tax=Streptomyces cupreus TaxID=2759956 RepID=A0A7X1J5V0_9ACTN|nr:peptidoglycan-binding protein [Streptomyces cupreus]MBC2902232.1 peptidoglycan-binding protein [Streptomyces cupreus]